LTSIESDARLEFGLLIKTARAGLKLNRFRFARLVGVKVEVIRRLEHGVVNPTRRELVRAIKVCRLSDEKKNEAYCLLRIFSSRRQKRSKFHLHCTIIQNRKRG